MDLCPYLAPITKINPRWIKDLSIRSRIIKFLDGNVEKALFDIVDIGIDFDITLKAQATVNKNKLVGTTLQTSVWELERWLSG